MDSLLLTKVDNSVKVEIEKRSQSLKTNGAWATRRTPWIRAESFTGIKNYVGLDSKQYTDTLAKQHILFSKYNTNFESSYPNDIKVDSYKLRPIPTITSLEVDYKGVYGSSRHAKLNFQVWTRDQLNIYQKLYMIPGRTVLVEWGWSLDANGSRTIPLSPGPDTDANNTKKIKDYRAKNPNYDAFQGRIVNFSFALNKELGYDCVIELLSTGDMVLGSNINSTSNRIKTSKDGILSNLYGSILSKYTEAKSITPPLSRTLKSDSIKRPILDSENTGNFNNSINTSGPEIEYTSIFLVNGQNDFKLVDTKGQSLPDIGSSNEADVYINFEGLLDLVNQSFAKYYDGKISPSRFKITDPVVIPRDELLMSTDPFVCVFREQVMFIPNNFDSRGDYSCPVYNSGQTTALNYLWYNCKYLFNVLNSSDSVHGFLETILHDASDCLGDICNLVFAVDETDPTICKIIDQSIVNVIDKIDIFTFTINSLIIRESNVSTKLTDSLKQMVLFSSNAQSLNTGGDSTYKAFQSLASNTVDLANPGDLATVPNVKGTDQTQPDFFSRADTDGKLAKQFDSQQGLKNSNVGSLFLALGNLARERTQDTVTAAKSSLKTYLAEGSAEDTLFVSKAAVQRPDLTKLLFPLEFYILIDGIAGFQFGNAIYLDYLPEDYENQMIFQIKQVKHKIDMSGWDTEIETICRVDPNGK